MKKLIVGLLLAISTISLGGEKESFIEETPYFKEIIDIKELEKIRTGADITGEIYIVRGINEDLTPEVEEKILQIPRENIAFKSYIFGKDCVKVRVLYIEKLKENKQ